MTEKPAEEPRGIAFHWLANMVLASIALFAGVLFGERIPREQLGVAFLAVSAVALALVPLTRYWEKTGIRARQKAAEQAQAEGTDTEAPKDRGDDLPEDPDPPA